MWHCYTTDTVFVRVSLLLTDQTPDSGNPLLICCHGAVLLRRFNKNTNTVEKRERQKKQPNETASSQRLSSCVYLLSTIIFSCCASEEGCLPSYVSGVQ